MNIITGTATAVGRTVQKGAETAEAVVGTAKQIGKVGENTGELVNKGITVSTDVLDRSGKLTTTGLEGITKITSATGDVAANLTTNTGEMASTAVTSLNTQLGKLNNTTSILMDTTNDSLKNSGQAASGITAGVSSSVTDSVNLGSSIIKSITNILTYPFQAISDKIENIKNNKNDPATKAKNLKNAVLANFKEIKKKSLYDWKKQFLSLIKAVDSLTELFKKIGCKVAMFGRYDCTPEINLKLTAIQSLRHEMETIMSNSLMQTERIFQETAFEFIGAKPIRDDASFDERQHEYELKQTEIFEQATQIYEDTIKQFTDILNKVKRQIDLLQESITSVLDQTNTQQVSTVPVVETTAIAAAAAGGKGRRKRTRKIKHKKRRRSQKRK